MKYLLLFFACFLLGGIIHSCGNSENEDFQPYQTGLIIPEDWEEGVEFEEVAIPTALPERFEYENVGEIRNQGSCGSCWSFGIISVVEFLHRGITGNSIDLSEQHLVSSCSNAGSCFGGYISAFHDVQKTGLPLEQDDPYLARNSICKQTDKVVKISRWSMVGAKGRQPTTDEIKAAIMTYGMVVATIAGSGAIQRHKGSKTYTACDSNNVNHIINLHGWKTENGQTVWRMKNSWSKNFGDSGFAWILAEKNGRKCNQVGSSVAFAVYDFGE